MSTDDFRTGQRDVIHDEAMAAAKHCIQLVVRGDPDAQPGSHASADRKANANAALLLVQTARTLEGGRR